MPATLTLKNIPDAIYDRLRASADAHRRSMNSEAIVCLETVLLPRRVNPDEQLSRIRELRASLNFTVTAEDVEALLDPLVEQGLMVSEARRYLALALPLPPRQPA